MKGADHKDRLRKPSMGGDYSAGECLTTCNPSHGGHSLLGAPPLHRGRNPHRFAVFGNCPARDIDARLAQLFHDGVIREHVAAVLGVDQLPDAVAHRLGGMRFAAVRR